MEAAVAPRFTPRQRQVLDLLVKGYTNSQIADALGVSLDGAKWHVREIMAALGVDGREEAAEFWREYNGLPRRLWRVTAGLLPLSWPRVLQIVAGMGVAASVVAVVVALTQRSPDAGNSGMPALETASPTPSPTPPPAILPSPAPSPEAITPVRTLRADPPTGHCDQVFRLVADKFEVASTVEFHRWKGLEETVLLANDRLVGHDGGASLDGVTLPDDCFPGATYVSEVRPVGGGVAPMSRAVFIVANIGNFTADVVRPGCNPAVVRLRGSQLPPGTELALSWGSADPLAHSFAELASVSVGSDGLFDIELQIPYACGSERIGIYGFDKAGEVRARWRTSFAVPR